MFPTIGNGIQKASLNTRDKYWFHGKWPHKLFKSYNCHPHSEDLIRYYVSSPAVISESVSFFPLLFFLFHFTASCYASLCVSPTLCFVLFLFLSWGNLTTSMFIFYFLFLLWTLPGTFDNSSHSHIYHKPSPQPYHGGV